MLLSFWITNLVYSKLIAQYSYSTTQYILLIYVYAIYLSLKDSNRSSNRLAQIGLRVSLVKYRECMYYFITSFGCNKLTANRHWDSQSSQTFWQIMDYMYVVILLHLQPPSVILAQWAVVLSVNASNTRSTARQMWKNPSSITFVQIMLMILSYLSHEIARCHPLASNTWHSWDGWEIVKHFRKYITTFIYTSHETPSKPVPSFQLCFSV